MLIEVLKSKLHNVTVTQAELDYEGSITIDEALMDAADICVGEKVHINNRMNAERIETYVIPGPRNSGVVCMNGPAARHAQVGDVLVINAFGFVEKSEARTVKPIVLKPDAHNKI